MPCKTGAETSREGMILFMGERNTDEPPPNKRLTVAQAAAQFGISEGAVRSRIKRGTMRTERIGGSVYVVLDTDEPPPNIGEPTDEPSSESLQARLIESYEARIESLERQLQAERDAHGESRRIIAGLVQRIPELESSPQSPEEAESVAEGAAANSETEEETSNIPTEPQSESSQNTERRPWWRRIFGG